ncbi:MAG: hypothetical protein MHM6MM_000566 [Cercozoa sp. M6MM]
MSMHLTKEVGARAPQRHKETRVYEFVAPSEPRFTKHETDAVRPKAEMIVREIQHELTSALFELDPTATCIEDSWDRAHGRGGGITRVLTDGKVFEKAGVAVSVTIGTLPLVAAEKMTAHHAKVAFAVKEAKQRGATELPLFAASVSTVIHPHNPHAPTGHMNYRFFQLGLPGENGDDFEPLCWWCGGGGDLTPSILYHEDARLFHQAHKDMLDEFDTSLYPRFKKWCDEYFLIKHRGETRGIGGIFFDDLDEETLPQAALLQMLRNGGAAFTKSFTQCVRQRCDSEFEEHHKLWQQVRRGRYVEFNLVYDRGTSFGLLKPGARIESILMSMPLTARWEYCHETTHAYQGSFILD